MSLTKSNPFIAFIKDICLKGLETIGRYYSSYRGFVVDNKDPENLGRIKLKVPEVWGGGTHDYWAFPKTWSGDNHGIQIIPSIGEMVWVEFEQGHPEVPIYSHGHFGRNEMPTDDQELLDVKCYWLRTPGGITVKLNDTKKTITVQANGAEIVMQADGRFSIKNGAMDLKTLLENMSMTYMKTKTITGDILGPDSIKSATQDIVDTNKLFS